MKVRILIVFFALLIFIVGMAIGRELPKKKSIDLNQPITMSVLLHQLIYANMAVLRDNFPTKNGIGLPEIYYDFQNKKVKAMVWTFNELDKQPLSNIKMLLHNEVLSAIGAIAATMPTIKTSDIEVEFLRLQKSENKGEFKRLVFAEWKNEKLIIN